MLDGDLVKDVLRRAFSSGGDYADMFVEWRNPTVIVLEGNKVEKCTTGIETGVGIRVIRDGKTFFGVTNDLTKNGLFEVAHALDRTASRDNSERDFDFRTLRSEELRDIKMTPQDVPIENKIALVREVDGIARDVNDPAKIRQVSVTYRDAVQRVQIATSDGVLVEDERIYTVGLVTVVAAEGDTVQSGYESLGGFVGFELFDDDAFQKSARKASGRALRMLSARRAPGGRMPVVISSEAGGTMIHEAIGHGLEADLAGQNLSRFSNMRGKQVASPLVTVIDDATLPGKMGSYRFDDEGTPAQRTVLVKEGILTGYMYDKLAAIRDGTTTTGNGRRESYRHRPIPRMSNTFLAPGSSGPEDVLRATDRGLFVKKMGGGQVNTVSGDFVFDVMEGYLIDNGRIGEPVRGATLMGNGPEVLKSMDMVASDLGFSFGTCGKDSQGMPVSDAVPTVRIPQMVVGGAV